MQTAGEDGHSQHEKNVADDGARIAGRIRPRVSICHGGIPSLGTTSLFASRQAAMRCDQLIASRSQILPAATP
jgi:hypothetical protein